MSWFWRMLRGVRAGEKHMVWNKVNDAPTSIVITSPAFSDGGHMPQSCAGRGVGDNRMPALSWSGVPANAAELVLVLEDPGAPVPRPIVHMVMTGIAPDVTGVGEGATVGVMGVNSRKGREYRGPRPVPGHGPHDYVFELFALDTALPPRPEGYDKKTLVPLMRGHVIARGRLTGIYERT